MKVYFSTSASNIDKNISACRKIVDIIQSFGHTITRDWIEDAYQNLNSDKKLSKEDVRLIYEDNVRALREADVVILEATNHTFNMGYLAGIAVNLQKPLLIITSDQNYIKSFLIGESNSLKQVMEYTKISDLDSIVSRFLEDNNYSDKETRFNMVLGRNLQNYLGRLSARSGKSKAQIVREIIKEYSDEND